MKQVNKWVPACIFWGICRSMVQVAACFQQSRDLCQCIQPLHRRPPIFLIGLLGEWWPTIWSTTGSRSMRTNSWPWCPSMALRKLQIQAEVGPHLCPTSSIWSCCFNETSEGTKWSCTPSPACGIWRLLYSTPGPSRSTGSAMIEGWTAQTSLLHSMLWITSMLQVGKWVSECHFLHCRADQVCRQVSLYKQTMYWPSVTFLLEK